VTNVIIVPKVSAPLVNHNLARLSNENSFEFSLKLNQSQPFLSKFAVFVTYT